MAGWFMTMPTEWQARQLPLATSDPGPGGNMAVLSGSVTFTDFRTERRFRLAAERHHRGGREEQDRQSHARHFVILLTLP